MVMSRFDAEAIIRAAASGAIPSPGDVLLRVQEGWIFGQVELGSGSIPPSAIVSFPFHKLTGQATKGQIPATVAYEDEINIFLLDQTFQAQVRRGIRTINTLNSPYIWQTDDWHLNVDTDSGDVRVMVPDAADHFDVGFTDQLHMKNIGTEGNSLILSPEVLGQSIDGHSEARIRKSMRSFTLVSDGTGWWIQ